MLASVETGVRWSVDAVSDPGDGGDDTWLAEPLAQSRDGDADGVRERIGVLVPGALQQLLCADDAAFGRDENLEHGELLAGQGDVAVVAVDLAAERVEPQARDLAHGRPVVRTPAVERTQSEHELPELERLRQVVVGTELEAGDLVVEPVGRGQHQHGQPAPRGDDVPGDLVSGRAGDIPVEDGDVVRVDVEHLERRLPVGGDVRRDRRQAEAVADGLGHVRLVLDDQDPHGGMLEPTDIAGVWKTAYGAATPGWLDWERVPAKTPPSEPRPDPTDPCARAAPRGGTRRDPRPPGARLL